MNTGRQASQRATLHVDVGPELSARVRGRFVFVVKSDGRRSSTGVGVACQAIDFIGFPVDFFDRRLRAQKRARFQPPVPVFGVVCDGRISLA